MVMQIIMVTRIRLSFMNINEATKEASELMPPDQNEERIQFVSARAAGSGWVG